jgi:hypothetical protein
MYHMTAAHRTLPLGTIVVVTRLQAGRRVVVRINDRGPYVDPERRIIDLSRAARRLGVEGPQPRTRAGHGATGPSPAQARGRGAAAGVLDTPPTLGPSGLGAPIFARGADLRRRCRVIVTAELCVLRLLFDLN